MGRITIKDIARALRLNVSTVSRALRGQGDVSVETREMVRRTAEALGYQPNVQAIRFRERRSGLIGLIVPHMNMFFLPSVIEALEQEVRARGHNLVVFQSGDSLAKEEEVVRICQGFGVDGLLASVSKETMDAGHFLKMVELGTPVVLFDRTVAGAALPYVMIHDALASERAVTHLADRGCRRIGGLFDDTHLRIAQERFAGFQVGLAKAGLVARPEEVAFTANMSEGREAMRAMLARPEGHPDGLFVMSDELLAVTMQVVHECGIRVPAEMAIVSVSEGKLPYFLAPRTTHIVHSGFEVGQRAAELLFDLVEGRRAAGEVPGVVLDTGLVVLESA